MLNSGNKWQPLIYGVLIAAGIALGIFLRPGIHAGNNKFSEVLSIINEAYVDTVNNEELEEETINDLLGNLDPHSVYIPAKDLQLANEQLEGNFEGIGVEFNIFNDTILVVSALNGGPAQELGIMPGDRIVMVDSSLVAGNGITSERVFKLLRGKKGTLVNVRIFRPSTGKFINYTIKRNTIPIYSIDASFMLNNETGYIKISRFSATTHDEFISACARLKSSGMTRMILDLRGNPGGYLNAATELADEFLAGKKLIVYTEGRTKPRQNYYTSRAGIFEEGRLAILIDEFSASASEILSGAVQDWDRGLLVGRRSFGKGLVQQPFELRDGSALRLTVSRYFTPSGRCLQKDYKKDLAGYEHDLAKRFESGELEDESKKVIFDSTPYKTQQLKRTVYGGGGIYPDVFAAMDTSYYTDFFSNVAANSLISRFAYYYLDQNRTQLGRIRDLKTYNATFNISDQTYNDFVEYCSRHGVEKPKDASLGKSSAFIRQQLKALIARQLWRENGYYTVMATHDNVISKGVTALDDFARILSRSR
jgi:carboxyl-terminal processing protease